MNLHDFYYELPQELIAQEPLKERDSSRLMVLHKKDGSIEHRIFKDIIYFLNPGDCLVLNDTRVIPARLIGHRVDTGGTIEFLLLRKVSLDTWEVLVKPGRRAKIGTEFIFGEGDLKAEVIENTDAGGRIVRFYYKGVFEEILDKLGQMPLPPYIKRKLEDKERYQTVYSRHEGSAAAPTAGLHFTGELLDKISKKGVHVVFITLHVGLGTFRPVKVEKIEDHHMHSEFYIVTEDAAKTLNDVKQKGGRIICVGTTSVRTLETVTDDTGTIHSGSGWTDIFIYPGYRYKAVDGLITNFHLPESTLIMLVCAFGGYDNVMKAYRVAVEERYRFYSFGDAMLII